MARAKGLLLRVLLVITAGHPRSEMPVLRYAVERRHGIIPLHCLP
jgi:hypothetical protein